MEMIDILPLGNSSDINNSICYEEQEYCVESTIYRKVLGTIIFVMVWPFIVLDIKKFPLGRPAAALLGATLMVLFVVVPQTQVYIILGEKGNLQTLFLLVGMMLLSYYYDREGMLNYISLYIFGKNKAFKHVLWKVCVLSAILSAIITNDATCVVLTPLLLAEHVKQDRSKKEIPPLLIGIATSANIGSASTFFGNPQNAFIAANSQGEVSLLVFIITTLPAAVIGLVISMIILHLCYFRTVRPRTKRLDIDLPQLDKVPRRAGHGGNGITAPTSISDKIAHQFLPDSRREFAHSYDQNNESSGIAEQHNNLSTSMHSLTSLDHCASSGAIQAGDTVEKSLLQDGEFTDAEQTPKLRCDVLKKRIFITWLILITIVVVILLAIPPPPVVSVEFNLGLVPVGAAVMTMLVDTIINKKYALDAMMKVDWTMILLFMGLFVWLAGFQNTLFPKLALDFVSGHMDLNTVQGVLFFAVFIAVGSNILSNVPLVILVVDQLFSFQCGDGECTGQLTGVLLAWVSTIAGNFTLIGSIANLIVAEKARNMTSYRLGFWEYLKFGLCSTTMVLLAGLPIVYFVGSNVHI